MKQFKKFTKNILQKLLEKGVVGIILLIWKWIWNASVAIFMAKVVFIENKVSKIQNPYQAWFDGVVINDEINDKIRNRLEKCNTEGIFAGLFMFQNGVGKFVFLQGRWDFNTSDIQKDYLKNTQQFSQYKELPELLQVCNSVITHFKSGNTKDTNPALYNKAFVLGSETCDIDANTREHFTNAIYINTILDIKHFQNKSIFTQCITSNLNLSKHFNNTLEKIYVYPIKLAGVDFAFLTLSFVKGQGNCFEDKEMKAFFEDIKDLVITHGKHTK